MPLSKSCGCFGKRRLKKRNDNEADDSSCDDDAYGFTSSAHRRSRDEAVTSQDTKQHNDSVTLVTTQAYEAIQSVTKKKKDKKKSDPLKNE